MIAVRPPAVSVVVWCAFVWVWRGMGLGRVVRFVVFVDVGSRSQAGCLKRNTAMDDSIGGS